MLLHDGWDLFIAQTADLPPLAPGYEIRFDDTSGEGQVLSPHGTLLDRLPPVRPEWHQRARSNGHIVVFAGSLRLYKLDGRVDLDGILTLMDQARQRGELATTRIKVGNSAPRDLTAAQRISEDLENVIHRVRPGNGSNFDDAPLIVPYPVEPRALVTTVNGHPAVVVDLNDEDDLRARRTLKSFQRAGLGIVSERQDRKLLPTGWGAVLWPTQVLIQTPKTGAEQRIALFAEYGNPALTWYGQARGQGSVSVLFTNLKGRDLSNSAILNRIRRGKVVGGEMFSMCTV